MSNLLPPNEKQEIVRLYRLRFVSVALGSLALLALAGVLLLFPSIFFLKNTQATLLAEKNLLTGHETTGLQGSLTSALADINSRLAVFADPAPASPLIKSFIDLVLKAKTPQVRITDFVYKADPLSVTSAEVQISGIATDREALLTFSGALTNTAGVTNVAVPITSFLKNTNVMFTISATVALN